MRWDAYTALGNAVDRSAALAPVFAHHLRLLTERIAPSVERPAVAAQTEDYIVYRVARLSRPDGTPAVIMVLLKGFDAAGFVFYTNHESRKGEHLLAHPKAAMLFHWKSLRRQVRLEGPVAPTTAQEADAYFGSRDRGRGCDRRRNGRRGSRVVLRFRS